MAALGLLLRRRIENPLQLKIICRNYSCFAKMMEYKKCSKILGIPEDSDQETIRQAYLKLVKRFHPDSGTPEADATRFAEIDRAFRILLKKKSTERWNVDIDIVQEQDIKHIAPQHRHYLSYDGVGTGTPLQRQKQYTKYRAVQAAEIVFKHHMSKISAEEGALMDKSVPLKHTIKTKYGLERLVEDLIQESMSRGEFNNISGTGKPLPTHQNQNPYVDFVTHKLNEILINNGFTPEWITLQKEIREELQQFRMDLSMERSYLGPYPLSPEENSEWNSLIIDKYENVVEQINKKITKFNLVVPIMNKQKVLVNLLKESEKILIGGLHSQTRQTVERRSEKEVTDHTNIFSLIEYLFKK